MKSVVKKIINIRNHKIEDFGKLLNESDLIKYIEENNIIMDIKDQPSDFASACPIEVYKKIDGLEKSTTVIIDINGLIIAYNNGTIQNLV